MKERNSILGTGLIILEFEIFDLLSDKWICIRNNLHIPILLFIENIFQIRKIIEISVSIQEFFELKGILANIADSIRNYVNIIFILDINEIEIEFSEIRKKISIRKETEIIFLFDSDIYHLIEFGLDEIFSSITIETTQYLLDLEIISRLIKSCISWGNDAATIIEELRFDRNDLGLNELFDITDAFHGSNLRHTIEFAEMLVDDRSDKIYKFFFIPDKFRIDEDIVHTDIIGKLDMFLSFIISKNISSFCYERSLTHMLLIEQRIIIPMINNLEKEQSQDKYKKKESKKWEQIDFLSHFDIPEEGPGLQPMFEFLIEIFIMRDWSNHSQGAW